MAAPRKLSGESYACGDASGGAVGLRPIASYESQKQEESGNLGKSPLLSGVVSRLQSGGSGVGLGGGLWFQLALSPVWVGSPSHELSNWYAATGRVTGSGGTGAGGL